MVGGDLERRKLALLDQESSDPSHGQTQNTFSSEHKLLANTNSAGLNLLQGQTLSTFTTPQQLCRQEQHNTSLSSPQQLCRQEVHSPTLSSPQQLCRQEMQSTRLTIPYTSASEVTVPVIASSSPTAFVPAKLLPCPEPDTALFLLEQLMHGQTNPPGRPNLDFASPIFNKNDKPAAPPSLRIDAFARLLADYPDQEAVIQILGAIQHGIRLGYSGIFESEGRLSQRNLPLTSQGRKHIQLEIEDRLSSGRLEEVNDPSSIKLVCSPIGTVPKPNSDKLRTIHHLSHPHHGDSINAGIDDHHAQIQYENLDKLLEFVRDNQYANLWKSDLKEAFRSIGIACSQARLMGFHFNNKYYMERTLAFGCRSSPQLFNAFAEMLHWLLEKGLGSYAGNSKPSHYLDDFFGATNNQVDAYAPVWLFQLLASALGFVVSKEKVFWNKTVLSILGIEIDTIQQTASISDKRRQKLIKSCNHFLTTKKATLLDMQKLAGHFQFVCRIAPHGRAFIRGLHDAVKVRYKSPYKKLRLGRIARQEIGFWRNLISSWDGLTLLQPSPLLVMHIWTDASSRALGAFAGDPLMPSHVLQKDVSRRHRSKPIHFLEALAVLESLRRFTPHLPKATKVLIHVDNEAIRHSITKGSSKDPLLQVLIREIFSWCLGHGLDLSLTRVSTKENVLADALSRRKFQFIAQHFPQAHQLLHYTAPDDSSPRISNSVSQHPLQPVWVDPTWQLSSSGMDWQNQQGKEVRLLDQASPLLSLSDLAPSNASQHKKGGLLSM